MLVTVFAGATAIAAESTLNETHADWQSRVVYDSAEIRFRAVATYAEAGDFVVLSQQKTLASRW